MKPRQLTDDVLDSFVKDLHDYVARHPLLGEDEGYDFLYDFVYTALEDYSNGYKNYN